MNGFLIIAGILLFIVGLYISSYYLNANTAVPEGIEIATCSTCNSASCSLRKKRGPEDQEELEECEVIKLD